jgi:hypothetical protein
MVRFNGMEHVRVNRARLYDWFIKVGKVFSLRWGTLWAAIKTMDRLIIDKKGVTV